MGQVTQIEEEQLYRFWSKHLLVCVCFFLLLNPLLIFCIYLLLYIRYFDMVQIQQVPKCCKNIRPQVVCLSLGPTDNRLSIKVCASDSPARYPNMYNLFMHLIRALVFGNRWCLLLITLIERGQLWGSFCWFVTTFFN